MHLNFFVSKNINKSDDVNLSLNCLDTILPTAYPTSHIKNEFKNLTVFFF